MRIIIEIDDLPRPVVSGAAGAPATVAAGEALDAGPAPDDLRGGDGTVATPVPGPSGPDISAGPAPDLGTV